MHLRSYKRGRHTTLAPHMPKAHQKHLEWSPSRIVNWATSIGPKTRELVEAILAERRHPEQGYRSYLVEHGIWPSNGGDVPEAPASRPDSIEATTPARGTKTPALRFGDPGRALP